jgi:hypothetical protein
LGAACELEGDYRSVENPSTEHAPALHKSGIFRRLVGGRFAVFPVSLTIVWAAQLPWIRRRKQIVKKFGLVIMLFAASGFTLNARADSTSVVSSTATTNSSGSATQVISPNPAWAAPLAGSSWISFTNTGDPSSAGFVVVPNGTAVTFTDTFNLTGTITGANLDVLADDTSRCG